MSDKATRAYAAITAQLSQFESINDGNYYDDEDNLYNEKNFEMDMTMDVDDSFVSSKSQMTNRTSGGMTNHGTDDDAATAATFNYTNRPTSLSDTSFSGLGSSSGRPSTAYTNNDNDPSTNPTAGLSSWSSPSYRQVSGTSTSSTVTTRQQSNHFSDSRGGRINNEGGSNGDNEYVTMEDNRHSNGFEQDFEVEDEKEESLHQYNESIDGDYRPYHDALLSFHHAITSSSSSLSNRLFQKATSEQKLYSAQVQYMNRIMRSNYDRSTIIQQQHQSDDDVDDYIMNYVTTARYLEKEGHFWSLLIQLFTAGASSSSSSASGGIPNLKFLLWDDDVQNSSELTRKSGFGSSNNTVSNINNFIQSVVGDNVNIEPAEMMQLIHSYFEEDEEDHDGNKEGSTLPSIIKRRQIILGWIESCHNRSIPGFELGKKLQQNKKQTIMWHDTLQCLQSKNSSTPFAFGENCGGVASGNKITFYHPDAPLVLRKNNRANAMIQPLYGDDETTDTYLLSTCLSLIKAGRLGEALECCRDFGQGWRAALWDGNGAHGYHQIAQDQQVDGTGNDNGGNDCKMDGSDQKMVLIGNPQRSLWKRSIWLASRSMHSLLTSSASSIASGFSSTTGNADRQTIATGSIVYEAAITSILADDVSTALTNPIFKRNWMDLAWVYYRGKQARFMEQVYCTHNTARRLLVQSNNRKYPLVGTEFEAEEKEQLSCTQEISVMDDGTFLRNLEQQYASKSDTSGDNDDLPWRPGMCAFLSSFHDVQSFLLGNISALLENAEESKRNDKDGEKVKSCLNQEEEVLLRFIFHLIILLDSLTSNNDKYTEFRENVIVPYRNDLLLLYLEHLMVHKPLWKFTCLYASLLPMGAMIDSLSEFWMSSIHDDNGRRMILNQAREYLSEGLDLVILRKVVRASISVESGTAPQTHTAMMKTRFALGVERGLEQLIPQEDLVKVHSIRWLCLHNEHYADALVCANMLLRQFLLQVDTSVKNEEIGDWSDDMKLRTAKLFTRFLPRDFVEKALNGGGILAAEEMTEANANNMSAEEFQDYHSEFEAIGCFLEAHGAYQAWKDLIISLSPTVQFRSDSKFASGSLESEIAMKMDKRNYIQKKRKHGLALIKVAEVSYQSMMEILTYDGGFLISDSTELGIVHSIDEMKERSTQMHSLRSKCLPLTMFLTYRVLTETAQWMNDFVEDIIHLFKDEALDILSRIHMIQDDEDSPSPFLPESWHAKASLLSDTLNDENYGILNCLNGEEIEYFHSLMTETTEYLKECEERII